MLSWCNSCHLSKVNGIYSWRSLGALKSKRTQNCRVRGPSRVRKNLAFFVREGGTKKGPNLSSSPGAFWNTWTPLNGGNVYPSFSLFFWFLRGLRVNLPIPFSQCRRNFSNRPQFTAEREVLTSNNFQRPKTITPIERIPKSRENGAEGGREDEKRRGNSVPKVRGYIFVKWKTKRKSGHKSRRCRNRRIFEARTYGALQLRKRPGLKASPKIEGASTLPRTPKNSQNKRENSVCDVIRSRRQIDNYWRLSGTGSERQYTRPNFEKEK